MGRGREEQILVALAIIAGVVVVLMFSDALWSALVLWQVMDFEKAKPRPAPRRQIQRGVQFDTPYSFLASDDCTDSAVVYLPGIFATCEDCDPLVQAFSERRHDAYMIHRPDSFDIISIATAVLRTWASIKKKDYARCALVGHSFGGLVALHLSIIAREQFSCLVLVHPYLGLEPKFMALAIDSLLWQNVGAEWFPFSSYRQMLRQYAMVAEYQKTLLNNLKKIQIPVSVVLAECEHLVSNEIAKAFAEGLRAFTYRTWSSHYFTPSSASFSAVLSAIARLTNTYS